MDDIQFNWDDHKNIVNIKKHGVGFAEAARVYFDPEKLELFDEKHTTSNEERWDIIGNVNTKILFVVVIRQGDTMIRIISARQATKREQEAYYGNHQEKHQ